MRKNPLRITTRLIAVFLLTAVGLSCSVEPGQKAINEVGKAETPEEKKTVDEWVYEKTDGQEIVFKNGKRINTRLYQLKYIRSLKAQDGTTFLVLSGVGCTECDANISIYIHNPADGDMKGEAEQERYLYPGKIKFYEDNTLISESRMFVGNCLTDKENLAVWYQKDLNDDEKWVPSVVIASVEDKKLSSKVLKKGLPDVEETLALTKSGKCIEVSGIDRTSEP